ncbi:phage terminase large subunit [Nitrincola sp. A-D6]|uniref:phage terminase large subunit n=1 Tax=Nitrincola sp. A-D6 TaxID=1545442 RepID=UPI00190F3BF5|nr:phage terminase large subunit [Nitrincola sp. A-D6]
MLNGNLFVMDAGGVGGGYTDEALTRLAKLAKRWEVNEAVVESNFGDGMFTQLLKPYLTKYHKCTVEERRSSGQKEKRIIDTLEPVLMQHRLIVDMRLIEEDYKTATDPKYSLFFQLTRITAERGALAHDDRLDALAIAVAYWTEQMDLDQQAMSDKHQDELLEKELRKFMEHAGGFVTSKKGWFERR